MEERTLDYYLDAFGKMNRAMVRGVKAPHKPLLLLSVLHLVRLGEIVDNRILLSNSLISEFKRLWAQYIGNQDSSGSVIVAEGLAMDIPLRYPFKCSIENPYFHLQHEPFWWLVVVAVANLPNYDFNRCKSVIYKFLSRDQKSARDKNGTKPRKNKVKNTSPEISLVEYLCFVCKGTNLSLEKRGKIPISLIHNSFSYHCTPNVVIASDFDLKRHGLRKLGVKFCFALCCTFFRT